MDDSLLLSRAAAGDLESFGQLYDLYFPRVYDFSYRVLLDSARAAELTASVFDQALRGIASVPRDQSFGTWLFALAYHGAVGSGAPAEARLSASDAEAFGAFEAPDPARIADSSMVEVPPERAELAWDAATALSRADRAFLDLHLRQELSSAEIAPIIGANPRQAATIVTRMQAAARDVMTQYIVARSSDCDALRAAIGPAGLEPYTQEARAAVADHVARCPACQDVRRAVPDPVEVYSYFAPVDAPLSLKGDIWAQLAETWATGAVPVASTWRSAPAAGAAAAAGGIGDGGGGGSAIALGGDSGFDRRQMLWFAAAAAGLILFAFVFGAVLVRAFSGGDDGGSSQGASGGTATSAASLSSATAATSTTPGVAVQTPTPNLTPSVTPTPGDTPTAEAPTAAPPTSTPPPTNTVAVPTVPRATATPTRPATPTPILPRG